MHHLTTIIFIISLTVLATVHYFAMTFNLYWTIPYLDMPVHFLGGATMVMGLFAVRNLGVLIPEKLTTFWGALFFIIIVAIGWEIFEYSIAGVLQDNYVQDTISDLLIGIGGGVFGWWFAIKIKFLD